MDENEIALRIEAFDEANGGGVGWYEDKGVPPLPPGNRSADRAPQTNRCK
jgi:hypothetical protein